LSLTCPFAETIEVGVPTAYTVQVTGGQPPYQYYWFFAQDTLASSDRDTIRYDYSQAGSYEAGAQIIDGEGCQISCQATQLALGVPIFPNVFTPNGDRMNDTFTIQYPGDNFQMDIYKQWGRLISTTQDGLHGWDGSNAPTAMYYYQVKIACTTFKGWVSLLR
jgi:gliding motility-associated-like protein